MPGTPATVDQVAHPVRFAKDLADFVATLRRVDTTAGPRPGVHNWYRGGSLRTFGGLLQDALDDLDGHVDADVAREIWQKALHARWDGTVRWFHGDLAQGNLLLDDGQLSAVLDFGTCGIGDPACDLAIAWTLLTADVAEPFGQRLSVDDDEWSRGRGWALWKTLTTCATRLGDHDQSALDARRALAEVLTEYGSGGGAPGEQVPPSQNDEDEEPHQGPCACSSPRSSRSAAASASPPTCSPRTGGCSPEGSSGRVQAAARRA